MRGETLFIKPVKSESFSPNFYWGGLIGVSPTSDGGFLGWGQALTGFLEDSSPDENSPVFTDETLPPPIPMR